MIERSYGENLLDIALSKGAIFAEIYLEDTLRNDVAISNGNISNINNLNSCGIGIRIFDGISTIYASTNDSNKKHLELLVRDMTLAMSNKSESISFNHGNKVIYNGINDVEFDKVVDLLKECSIKRNDKIINLNFNYINSKQKVTILNSLGTYSKDVRSIAFLMTHLEIDSEGKKEIYLNRIANTNASIISLISNGTYINDCFEGAMKDIVKVPCPSGKIPVLLSSGSGGIIFHEACGHNLEAAKIVSNSSVFCNKIGEKVASENVTLLDDGTLFDCCGTMNIDDEGEKTRRNILIENGILKSYLVDQINAYKLDMKPTGSARRQSYRFAPTARMTNTFLLPGDMNEKEIISNTEFAILVTGISGGSVNPVNGDFSFKVLNGNIIQNGEVGSPISSAVVRGNAAFVLKNIDAVGNMIRFEEGMCIAESGLISTSVGQPLVRIKELEVGGV